MAIDTKPRRSERRGERPSNAPLPQGISLSDLEKAGKKLLEILANAHLPTDKEVALLEQARLACRSIKAYQANNLSLLNQIHRALDHQEKILDRLGVSQPEIIKQNLWISRIMAKEKDGLDEFLRGLETKMAQAK